MTFPDQADPYPVSWVQGPPYWWATRWLPASAFLLVSIVVLLELILYRATWTHTLTFAIVWGIAAGLEPLAHNLVTQNVPSFRRVGFSEAGLVIDSGFRRAAFAWNELHQVIRFDVHRYLPSGESQTTRRTRIVVGHGGNRIQIALSTNQADFLTRYLRLDRNPPLA